MYWDIARSSWDVCTLDMTFIPMRETCVLENKCSFSNIGTKEPCQNSLSRLVGQSDIPRAHLSSKLSRLRSFSGNPDTTQSKHFSESQSTKMTGHSSETTSCLFKKFVLTSGKTQRNPRMKRRKSLIIAQSNLTTWKFWGPRFFV